LGLVKSFANLPPKNSIGGSIPSLAARKSFSLLISEVFRPEIPAFGRGLAIQSKNRESPIYIHALLGRRVKPVLEAGEIGLGDGVGSVVLAGRDFRSWQS